jgi:glutathione S-transferase
MALALYFHPLASFCHKVLIALYENETPFTGHVVDLADKDASAAFLGLWPVGKIPVLHDDHRDRTIPETTIIIEPLDQHYPGACTLLPSEQSERLKARLWDRFFDLYVQVPMGKIVTDRLRADGEHDPRGVADARSTLGTAYDMIERRMAHRTWVVGERFSLADCAAAPALFYAAIVMPFQETHARLAAYFDRLMDRASVKRVIAEAHPYFHMFPYKESIPTRFLQGEPSAA